MTTPEILLKTIFGYDTFRPLQREVIGHVLSGRDTLAVLPTGGGKSLCYQIPALLFDGLSVVVSPLIALMKDQVEQLRAYGVPAVFLNSTLPPDVYMENMDAVRHGEVKLLYAAPETLLTPRLFGLLDAQRVDLLTIDEAHCISEWGHDFRPEYRQLVELRRRYPRAVCLALTATATRRVRTDIQSTLGFATGNTLVASFNRENLYIQVEEKRDPLKQTLQFLARFKNQPGIIYCFSRRQVDELCASLVEAGISARSYHAGLEDAQRKASQEAFIRDDAQVIVATIAFGMGINKPNVRFILHYYLPKSLENYYQEIGRAGRDGLPAHCLLLFSAADAAKLRYFVNQKEGDERRVAARHLDDILEYAENRSICRRKPLLKYFGETFPAENCAACDICTHAAPQFSDVTVPAQKFLSCVWRTGQRFGAGYVIDVLLGSTERRILENGHDQLSTYGIGGEWSKERWSFLEKQLLQLGYLQREEQFHTLSLTPRALDALKKRSPILAPLQTGGAPAPRRKRPSRQPALPVNNALLEQLRRKRKEIADHDGVPPYVVFPDTTLNEMAACLPQSPESLLNISGVGQVKLKRYGQDFLEVITTFCRRRHLKEIHKAAPQR